MKYYEVVVNGYRRIIPASSKHTAIAKGIKWAEQDHSDMESDKVGTRLNISCERMGNDREEVKQTIAELKAKREAKIERIRQVFDNTTPPSTETSTTDEGVGQPTPSTQGAV